MSVPDDASTVGHHNRPAPEPGWGVVDLDLAAHIAVEVQACPLVAGLHGGIYGAIFTDTVAGRLVGIRIDNNAIMIGVVSRLSSDTDAVVEQVRAAVRAQAPTMLVSVSVVGHHNPRSGVITIPEPRSDE